MTEIFTAKEVEYKWKIIQIKKLLLLYLISEFLDFWSMSCDFPELLWNITHSWCCVIMVTRLNNINSNLLFLGQNININAKEKVYSETHIF